MIKKNIVSIGFDLSLCGTGVAVLDDGKFIKRKLIKSKPPQDGKPIDEVKRIRKIVEELEMMVSENSPTVAVIEGIAYGIRNATALVQLSALNYMTRAMLIDYNVPFIIVAPTSLKKFITGNGAAKKDVMLIETFKRYGVTILNDNEADAYGLAQIGLALMGGNSKVTTNIQKDVLSVLKKQL